MLPKLFRDPLFLFLLVGLVLFGLNAAFPNGQKEQIVVNEALVENLVRAREDTLQRPLTKTEATDVVDAYIQEELLVREARNRGLNNSSRIRGLLVQNMRFFIASEVDDPTEQDLRDFYQETIHNYLLDETLRLRHVFFRDPSSLPTGLMETLETGASIVDLGDDRQGLGGSFSAVTEIQLATNFGEDFAQSIFTLDDDGWHGPLTSPRGVHFVRIEQRDPPREASFEEVRQWIVGVYIDKQRRDKIDTEVARIAEDYDIRIDLPKASGQ
ncbi:peptidyl-prolyl cis-trans isomerase [Tropicibacter sp. Alg240-R139]|uniref:peptidylprolyl isomerase n=1 Tax=Tropicibacter sp. Alg240-R139 TaxID=2305991 RepID=UPI0013DFF1F3|nr:peptidylprolyl isomerase [Tropicibacter sp. Alg240-R139]